MITNFISVIPLFYLTFGVVLYQVGQNSGKLDDVLLASTLLFLSLRKSVSLNAIVIFVMFLVYISVFSIVNGVDVSYWLYLCAVWLPIVLARPPEEPNKIAFSIFFCFYIVYLILHFSIGSRDIKYFNIDINVFNMFATLTAVFFLRARFLRSSSFVLIASLLSGVRSAVASALILLNLYPRALFVFSFGYIGLYFFALTQFDSNTANVARYHLLLNHLANYATLTLTELMWGAGPQAYSEQVVLTDTTVAFVTNKPKTVDSSILRMLLEFGVVPTLIILTCIWKYLKSAPLFIFYLILFGMSNEGLLSVYGPLSLLLMKSFQQQSYSTARRST